jgi:hypothetical protein
MSFLATQGQKTYTDQCINARGKGLAMSDPYRDWLGIDEPQRPLTHYQLLQLEFGEQNRDVIEAHVSRARSKVIKYLIGPHLAKAQSLMQEIEIARKTLLDVQSRRQYEASLHPAANLDDPAISGKNQAIPESQTVVPNNAWWAESVDAPATPKTETSAPKEPWWTEGEALLEASAPPPLDLANVETLPEQEPIQTVHQQPAVIYYGEPEPVYSNKGIWIGGGIFGLGLLVLVFILARPKQEENNPTPASISPEYVKATPKKVLEIVPDPEEKSEKVAVKVTTKVEPKAEPKINPAWIEPPADPYPVPDVALVQKVRENANKSTDPVKDATLANLSVQERFALWQVAVDRAIQTQEVEKIDRTISAMDRWFAIDDLEWKLQSLDKLAKSLPAQRQGEMARAGMQLFITAETQNRHDRAEEALRFSEVAARYAGSQEILDRVGVLRRQFELALPLNDRITLAKRRLQSEPEDAAANLLVGVDLCLRKGEWTAGLPNLAKSGHLQLRPLAELELTKPTDPSKQAELGAKWLASINQLDEDIRMMALKRSKQWLDLALMGDVKGFARLDASSKLADVNKRLSADAGATVVTPKKTPAAGSGLIVRRNYMSLKTDALVKENWVIQGEYRFETAGLRFLKDDANLASRFTLQDNWKVTMQFLGDGRPVHALVCGQDLLLTTAKGGNGPTFSSIERKGTKLIYTSQGANVIPPRTIVLPAENAKPSSLEFSLKGAAGADGFFLQSITITGPIQLSN